MTTIREIAKTTDTLLVEAWWRIEKAQAPVTAYRKMEADAAKRGNPFRLTAELAEAERALDVAKAIAAPLEAVAAAGLWSRFVLVPQGHLHKGFGCSTLRWTTRTGLMPEYSGADETEVVELAGERACTVCFPSAPVNRPSMLPADIKAREEAAAARDEKAAAKQAAAAQVVTCGRTTYKTLRAAENAISWEMDTMFGRAYQNGHDAEHTQHLRNLAAEDRAAIEAIADSIKETYPEWDKAAVLEKKFQSKAKEWRKAGLSIPADAHYAK